MGTVKKLEAKTEAKPQPAAVTQSALERFFEAKAAKKVAEKNYNKEREALLKARAAGMPIENGTMKGELLLTFAERQGAVDIDWKREYTLLKGLAVVEDMIAKAPRKEGSVEVNIERLEEDLPF